MASLAEQDIAAIGRLLEDDKRVQHHLCGDGRLHIDRQLPFLAVYRRPIDGADPGTDRLLLGQASYLMADDCSGWHEQLGRLVDTIERTQYEVFGGFLLLEIWARQDSEIEHGRPDFRIFAPRHNCPEALLEEFESALLQISIDKQQANVAIEYSDDIVPPGLASLVEHNRAGGPKLIHLGLEILPVYRGSAGVLFPFELKEMRHELGRALKRLFHAFTHLRTTHRPAHYHELGPRSMTESVFDTDRQLAAISEEFDLLLHVTPVNTSAAWAQFKQSRFQRMPEFLYRARPIDPGLLKRRLYQIALEEIEDPTLAHIFDQKREELDREITLLADRNTRRFMLGSRQLFGDVEPALYCTATEIIAALPAENSGQSDSESLTAEQFYELAKTEIEHYRRQDGSFDGKVVLRGDVSGLLVSQGDLFIGKDCRIDRARAGAMLAHEIGTHMLTYHNGRQQPLEELHTGMAGYQSMQEGLAVIGEYLTDGLDPARLRLLAGRVIAVKHATEGADFVETFTILNKEYDFEPQAAFHITMRVFRGGGYTKDIVYLRGLIQILDYLSTGRDLEPLYLGKISYEHLSFIQELEWRKILQPPRLRPRFANTPLTKSRIKKLKCGLSVLDLVEQEENESCV